MCSAARLSLQVSRILPRHMLSYIDGAFVDEEHATVSVRSRALNYGIGCFGGIRAYAADDGRELFVFRLDAHVRRLEQAARILFLPLRISREQLADAIVELLRRNELRQDSYVRPMVVSGAPKLAPVLHEDDAKLIIWCQPLARYIDKDSIDVCVSSWRRTPDNSIPARTKPIGGYLNSALARREATDSGFDEAIFLTTAGMVSEGSAEHVFIVRDGVLVSPPSTEDNLDGITRRTLIALASEDLGLRVVERPIGRTELYVADEMFLCGTGAQVTPVRSVDRRVIADGSIGPVTKRLSALFQDVVHGRVETRRDWLTPVWGSSLRPGNGADSSPSR
jgi:branched-chain amino acid aminotransferase